MQRVAISTDDAPEGDRLAHWFDACENAFGVVLEPGAREPTGPYRGEFSIRSKGPLTFARLDSNRVKVRRGSRQIAARSAGAYAIYREMGESATFRFSRREAETRRGVVLIADYDEWFEVEPGDRFNFGCLFVPRFMLDPHLPLGGRGPGSLSGLGGVGALAGSFIDALWENSDSLSAEQAIRVSDTLCRLIGIACGAAACGQSEAVRAGRLVEAKRYIEMRLADPMLGPERVASALKMSVRQLHLLFEPSGTTFAQYVVKRRLEECRTALQTGERSVTDIAFAWGFNSLATFFRRFHQAYGMTPCEMRSTAASPTSS
jgi:AraC-like DNA-binding protein